MAARNVEVCDVTDADLESLRALRIAPGQEAHVAAVQHYVELCTSGGTWHPVLARVDGDVVGFAMWAVDEDASRWIGGLLVDASRQGQGIGRGFVEALRRRLIGEPGCPNVALSYHPDNVRARTLYLSMGFEETGERVDEEVVARWRH